MDAIWRRECEGCSRGLRESTSRMEEVMVQGRMQTLVVVVERMSCRWWLIVASHVGDGRWKMVDVVASWMGLSGNIIEHVGVSGWCNAPEGQSSA
jgi:hypothetical protein